MKKQLLLVLAISALLWSSCGSGDSEQIAKEEAMLDSIMKQTAADHLEFSDEVVQGIIESIPSPLEMASLIQASGATYDSKMLNSADNVDNYNSIYTKGLNLGVYGADMGYINLYEKTTDAFSYIKAIKGLADDLKVGQFFDFATLKRLANNNSNMDSLLYISTSGFEKMDKYLKDNNRGNISMMILLGGWLESLHISTYVAEAGTMEGNPVLIERIGEQKIVLNDILLLLSVYEKDPKTKAIKSQFEELKTIYDEVNIVYEYAEPETKEVDGMLVIIDNSTSRVEIDAEHLKAITAKVKEIRNGIIL
jgi:hypothetical protein